MNYIASEMNAILNESIKENYLVHYGVGHDKGGHSGRYPWGSGDNPYQHSDHFLERVNKYKEQGLSESEIAEAMGYKTKDLRTAIRIAKHQQWLTTAYRAKKLREEGKTHAEIAKELGLANESSVRSMLETLENGKKEAADKAGKFLMSQVDKKKFIDVGKGVEHELGLTRDQMDEAVMIAMMHDYERYDIRNPQVTNKGQYTTMQVLCPPGTTYQEVYQARDKGEIESITEYTSHDDGQTFQTMQYPASMDSNRLAIRYADDPGKVTGADKDGVIEIRRGVADLDLGDSHYAQVRILVDGTHYIKGMAVYSDNLPEGKDILFNTNKKSGTPLEKVLKPIKEDAPDNNPFGSAIKAQGQSYYTDEKGEQHLSLINKTREEGDWEQWSDELPSQFLAKQDMKLINQQLNLSMAEKKQELAEIKALQNPVLKKYYLDAYASDCDSASNHLKAATLPSQKYSVILPVNSLKDNEVYAPRFKDGTKIALVRFPHEGTFQIPVLTVNNKNREGAKMIGNTSVDAIGITPKSADKMSGADFDGDTVITIPISNKVKITSRDPLKRLEGYDPKLEYPYMEGQRKPWAKGSAREQTEMGKISNLITDMTLKGASDDELARAVRHSMCVIDTGKHKLNYHQSEIDNGIDELKKKYQGHYDLNGKYKEGGASTLISRAKSEVDVPGKAVGAPRINKETGELEQTYKYGSWTGKDGKEHEYTHKATQMSLVKDAKVLSTGTPQEEAYANYANFLKSSANTARKLYVSTKSANYSSEAAKKYSSEVSSLENKLKTAEKNIPKERKAQVIAGSKLRALKADNPNMTKDEEKKYSDQYLKEARAQVGAQRAKINITDNEWNAIQKGAISSTKLLKLLRFADADELRQRAMPKESKTVTQATKNRIKAMQNAGYTLAQIAERLNISVSTVSKYLKE